MFAVNRPAGETVDNLVEKNKLQNIVSTEHASWNDAQTATSSFKRAEIWNLFLILMIIFLLEGAFKQLTKSLGNSRVMFGSDSWKIVGPSVGFTIIVFAVVVFLGFVLGCG